MWESKRVGQRDQHHTGTIFQGVHRRSRNRLGPGQGQSSQSCGGYGSRPETVQYGVHVEGKRSTVGEGCVALRCVVLSSVGRLTLSRGWILQSSEVVPINQHAMMERQEGVQFCVDADDRGGLFVRTFL